ncbi:Acyltransferase family [Teratosphaeria destructans]|uniref:Acyltransferase family n=1 Tax=Teratosphaeria destructans TaxID=418781 RepID=A0A9W7SX86_9PEZI|nr:Acyltransferase family [Teratosphaeria destructans]
MGREDELPERENSLENGHLNGDLEPKRSRSLSGGTKGAASGLGNLCGSIVSALRPSFLGKTGKRQGKLRKTAYLDGLRGFAAFMVYWLHHELWSHSETGAAANLQHGWGYNGEYYLAAFFGIRTFFTGGHYAVAIFFVLSGYVLSMKPLTLIHSGDLVALGDNVGSALFRRWFRLYIPIIVTTFISIHMWHVFGIWMDFVPQVSYRAEIWNWYTEFKNFSFLLSTGGFPWSSYNPHTWSIPVEMKGSISIYTSVLAFSRLTQSMRLVAEAGLIFYYMWIADGAHFALFTVGMMICEIELLCAEGKTPEILERLKPHKTWICTTLFVFSIFLGGCPSHSNEIETLRGSPGWYYLSFLAPQAVYDYKWFYLFWAAIFMVVSVPHLPWLKRFFEGRFCQYLGRISYMFYLCHGPVLWTLGDRVYAAVGWSREYQAMTIPGWVNRFPLPNWGPYAMEVNFYLPHLILLPVTFWAAELGTTLIDDPSIRFAQWLYKLGLPR